MIRGLDVRVGDGYVGGLEVGLVGTGFIIFAKEGLMENCRQYKYQDGVRIIVCCFFSVFWCPTGDLVVCSMACDRMKSLYSICDDGCRYPGMYIPGTRT